MLSDTLNSPVLFTVLLLPILLYLLSPKTKQSLLVNGRKFFELSDAGGKTRYTLGARELIKSGLEKASVFRIVSDNGLKTILDPKYAKEIRSHPALSFGAGLVDDFHGHIRGFEPFKQFQQELQSGAMFQLAIRTKLTQSLGDINELISTETALALDQEWTDNHDWHTLALKPTLLQMVAQVSSRIFLGDQICRNQEWLRITVSYTVDSFMAAFGLRHWPAFLRPLVATFLPSCRKIRRELDEASSIITPVLEERRKAKAEAIRKGIPPDQFNDALQWMEDVAKGKEYDAVAVQMAFSLAAIHTTSDMLTQVLYDLCGKEDIIQALRQEVIDVFQDEGLGKTTLQKLKLMDSVLKESQRLKPVSLTSMGRLAMKDLKLSDGTFIPKETFLLVSSERMWNPSIYPNPEEFDPYRFLKLREMPGHETSAQLVSPSPEHFGFGYGNHACPGRFFAANEAKIALAQILLKYDFKLPSGAAGPSVMKVGSALGADPMAKLSIRRRQEEVRF